MSFCHCALSSTSVWMCCCKRAHAIVISVLSFIYCLASNLKTDFIEVCANSVPKTGYQAGKTIASPDQSYLWGIQKIQSAQRAGVFGEMGFQHYRAAWQSASPSPCALMSTSMPVVVRNCSPSRAISRLKQDHKILVLATVTPTFHGRLRTFVRNRSALQSAQLQHALIQGKRAAFWPGSSSLRPKRP